MTTYEPYCERKSLISDSGEVAKRRVATTWQERFHAFSWELFVPMQKERMSSTCVKCIAVCG